MGIRKRTEYNDSVDSLSDSYDLIDALSPEVKKKCTIQTQKGSRLLLLSLDHSTTAASITSISRLFLLVWVILCLVSEVNGQSCTSMTSCVSYEESSLTSVGATTF